MLVIWVYGFRLSFFPPPSLLPQLLKGQLLSISHCAGTCTDPKTVTVLIQNNHINLGGKRRRAGTWSPYNGREHWRPTDLGGVPPPGLAVVCPRPQGSFPEPSSILVAGTYLENHMIHPLISCRIPWKSPQIVEERWHLETFYNENENFRQVDSFQSTPTFCQIEPSPDI